MVTRKLRELTDGSKDPADNDIQKLADTYNAFVNGTLEEVKGFCAVATTEEIAKQDYILTPGRYVGIEEQEDNGEPFEEKMGRLTKELSELFAKSYAKEIVLSALCDFQEGYVNPAQTHPEYFNGEVKWLRAVDINESFIIETSRTLTKAGFESAKKSAVLFKPNTIAISKSGTIGRLGIVADYMCGNRAVINIAPHDTNMLAFIYCFLKNKQIEFPNMAVGSVQKNLYVSLLEPLVVTMPEHKALVAFNSTGALLLNKISKLR